jgi:membrane associated rhomboid family serine protease
MVFYNNLNIILGIDLANKIPHFTNWSVIIITSLFSIIAINYEEMFARFKFNPYIILRERQWYRFISYAFVHAGWFHLMMNMFVLYSFGQGVELFMKYYFGARGIFYYLLLYVGGICISVIPSFIKHRNHDWYNAVGASGAVSAIVFSSIIIWPSSKIMFLFLPVPIPASIFGILYLIFSAYMAKRAKDNIGHDAHFWGALFGAIFTIAIKPALAINFYDQLLSMFK